MKISGVGNEVSIFKERWSKVRRRPSSVVGWISLPFYAYLHMCEKKLIVALSPVRFLTYLLSNNRTDVFQISKDGSLGSRGAAVLTLPQNSSSPPGYKHH